MTNDEDKEFGFGWYERIARQKSGDEFKDYHCGSLEALIETEEPLRFAGITKVGFVKRGAPYKSGPRKGQPRWDNKSERFVYVTNAERDAAYAKYEAETGRCYRCIDGKLAVGGSECSRCKGTGHVKVKAA